MNIEKTISEHAVSDILTPMLESQDRIVTEDVAPLFDQATGLDTPPASGTVTTTIEESRNLISAIIRKAWTATLTMLGGASVIGYIAAAYTYLRNRLQGNETYGIPDRRSEISASSPLAANLALLNDRKIGGADVADGMSMARILCDSAVAATITELTDDTTGWTMSRSQILNPILTIFPELTDLTINCVKLTHTIFYGSNSSFKKLVFAEMKEATAPILGQGSYGEQRFYIEEMEFPETEKMGCLCEYSGNGWWTGQLPSLHKLTFPKLKELTSAGGGRGAFIEIPCPALKNLDLSAVQAMNRPLYGGSCLQGLESLDLSGSNNVNLCHGTYPANISTALLLLKIKEGFAANLNLQYWSPTLDSSNLQQFLSNFRDYIALRLTDNGSGKTLTLSQAVRNAIHAAEATYGIENIIITQKGWTISPAPN